MLKSLIAVTTCHAYRDRANAIRQTWGAEVKEEQADVRYFLGRGDKQRADEVILDCPDGYHYLSLKTQLIRRWALEHGYEHLTKVDDDCYLRPERLFANGFTKCDYVGRLRGPSGNYIAPYVSGFCYGMSKRALELLAPIEWNADGDFSEDRWTAQQLFALGVSPTNESRLVVEYSKSSAISGREPPLAGNDIIGSCEYGPELMRKVHAQFHAGKRSQMGHYIPPAGTLSRVSIMVKTFLRDGFLMACLDGLEQNFPDARIVVVDDGRESTPNAVERKVTRYAELRRKGHACIWAQHFDVGFGAKANLAIPECMQREYVLIGSDDFDFSDPAVRPGVEAMQKVLDAVPSLGVVSGRVDGRPYECIWELGNKSLREIIGYHGEGHVDGTGYKVCDLTVNFSLIRTKLFDPQHGGLRWDGDVPIGGGEHSAFFLDVQRSYWGVAVIPEANINQLNPSQLSDVRRALNDKGYGEMRARARRPGRICLKRRGIDRYTLMDGTVELS